MGTASKKNILIVDDEEVNLQLLANILRVQGYETITAINGKEALQIIRKKLPDLVLLDVEMPELDGLELLKMVRKLYNSNQLPVVMITIKDASEDIVKALDSGANDYVVKPIDISVLLARIRAHLSVTDDGSAAKPA